MLSQVGLLREALFTTGLLTDKGSLSRVHPQMIEKVVPLPEKHLAVGLVALQNFHLAHSARIFIPKHAKSACRGHRLFDLDRVEVEVSAELNIDLRVLWDLFLHLKVRYVIAGDNLGQITTIKLLMFILVLLFVLIIEGLRLAPGWSHTLKVCILNLG